MPTIYEYFGIVIMFYSKEHLPIHIHAYYGSGHAMRVEFHLKGDKIERKEYKGVRGYAHFPPSQMRDLKALVNKHGDEMVNDWINFVIRNQTVKKRTITRRIK